MIHQGHGPGPAGKEDYKVCGMKPELLTRSRLIGCRLSRRGTRIAISHLDFSRYGVRQKDVDLGGPTGAEFGRLRICVV